MFFGKYDHQLDDRGRLRIPAAFKDELGTDFCLLYGISGVIDIYPRKTIEEQYKALLAKMNPYDKEDQRALRNFSSRIFNATLDKQGRLAIPNEALSYAKMKKDICSIGMGDHVCIMRIDHDDLTDEQYAEDLDYISKK